MSQEALNIEQVNALKKTHVLLEPLARQQHFLWLNPKYHCPPVSAPVLTKNDMYDANERLKRFAPYISKAFVETASSMGLIESPLLAVPRFKQALALQVDQAAAEVAGHLLLKCDSHLPIAGSIKARGGVYEVLFLAETLVLEAGLLTLQSDYSMLAEPEFQTFFARHSIVVGSTGNLGLSIGIMGAKLGFSVTVHMSADAREWKKKLLRSKGVTVVEHLGDYGKAVEQGRVEAEQTPNCHFVDDENSQQLFLGYSVAALRLEAQLLEQEVIVDKDHPLFVYLPCGVGGAPGGIAFGLKQVFGGHVHCFFAEPTAAPCMLLGMYTGLHDAISVQDIGLNGLTCADGLAVGRASGFVGRVVEPLLSGIYTIQDEALYHLLVCLKDSENIKLEPSALAGALGIVNIQQTATGQAYLDQQGLSAQQMAGATHIMWGTGGSMVPDDEYAAYYQKGKFSE